MPQSRVPRPKKQKLPENKCVAPTPPIVPPFPESQLRRAEQNFVNFPPVAIAAPPSPPGPPHGEKGQVIEAQFFFFFFCFQKSEKRSPFLVAQPHPKALCSMEAEIESNRFFPLRRRFQTKTVSHFARPNKTPRPPPRKKSQGTFFFLIFFFYAPPGKSPRPNVLFPGLVFSPSAQLPPPSRPESLPPPRPMFPPPVFFFGPIRRGSRGPPFFFFRCPWPRAAPPFGGLGNLNGRHALFFFFFKSPDRFGGPPPPGGSPPAPPCPPGPPRQDRFVHPPPRPPPP